MEHCNCGTRTGAHAPTCPRYPIMYRTMEEKVRYVQQIIKIREIINTFQLKGVHEMHDTHFQDGPNGFYCHTVQGFLLEWYYGMPTKLHTPWGYINLFGSGFGWSDDARTHALLVQHFDARILEGEFYSEQKMGMVGPTYELRKLDGVELPQLITFVSNNDRPAYEQVREDFCKAIEAASVQEQFPRFRLVEA